MRKREQISSGIEPATDGWLTWVLLCAPFLCQNAKRTVPAFHASRTSEKPNLDTPGEIFKLVKCLPLEEEYVLPSTLHYLFLAFVSVSDIE